MPYIRPLLFLAMTSMVAITATTVIARQSLQPSSPSATPSVATPPAAAQRPKAKERVKDIKDVGGTIITNGRPVKFTLHVQKTPTLCANFCNLVQRGFFVDQPWKGFTRVIRQAGTESVSYALPREFAPDLTFNTGSQLAYAKVSGKTADAANGTRVFVTIKEQGRWNLDFQIFGGITSGLDVLIDLKEGTTIEKITLDGDYENLLKAFAPEIVDWNAALDRRKTALKEPEAAPVPGDPNFKPPANPTQPRNGTPETPAKR